MGIIENHWETIGQQGFGSRFAQVRFKLGPSSKVGSGLVQASAAAGHGGAKDALGARAAGGVPPSLPAKPLDTDRDNGRTLAVD